jgi:tetratricopeptide (TPR) repeat protein
MGHQKGQRQLNKLLADLDQQMRALQLADGRVKETLAHGRKAAAHSTQKEWAAAANEYSRVAELSAEIGDKAAEALGRYGQGTALYQLPDKFAETRQAFERAAALAEQIEYHSLAARSHHLLGSLRLDQGDLNGAVDELDQAIDHLGPAGDVELTILVYRTRASVNLLRGHFDQIQADLDGALATARRAGRKKMVKSIRYEQRALRALQDKISAALDQIHREEIFADLLGMVHQSGDDNIIYETDLHQATDLLKAGQLEEALERAEKSRRAALESTEPSRYASYLVACLLMAEIKERLDDKPGVLFTLLTCKGTLDKTLGPGSSQLVTLFLDSIYKRWGPETTHKALEIYRQQIWAGQAQKNGYGRG